MTIKLRPVKIPNFGISLKQPQIPGVVFEARARAALAMAGTDWLVVYADREHFSSIAFLTGFEPRFEEAFLLLGRNDCRILVVGNESASYAVVAGLPAIEIMVAQSLSLMGQDRTHSPRLLDKFRQAGIKAGDSVGLVGWKYLEAYEDEIQSDAFFVPAVYVSMLRRVVGPSGALRDATAILFHPEKGLLAQLDADQIAASEWAATRASLAVWRIVSGVRDGDDEYQAAARMGYAAEHLNVHTMLASASPGEKVVGLRSANGRKLSRGDGITTAVGLVGALSSRAGLFDAGNDVFLRLATAYFHGLSNWYESADIGVTGATMHDSVTAALAEGNLSSALNPGHLTGFEEWTHSPVRPGSTEKLASGMLLQVDVIPVPMPGNWALNCEDAVALADQGLRAELKQKHPDTYKRIEKRRAFVQDELGMLIKENILLLSSTPLCLAPFWLRSSYLLAMT